MRRGCGQKFQPLRRETIRYAGAGAKLVETASVKAIFASLERQGIGGWHALPHSTEKNSLFLAYFKFFRVPFSLFYFGNDFIFRGSHYWRRVGCNPRGKINTILKENRIRYRVPILTKSHTISYDRFGEKIVCVV